MRKFVIMMTVFAIGAGVMIGCGKSDQGTASTTVAETTEAFSKISAEEATEDDISSFIQELGDVYALEGSSSIDLASLLKVDGGMVLLRESL